jgi:hypothetical protein
LSSLRDLRPLPDSGHIQVVRSVRKRRSKLREDHKAQAIFLPVLALLVVIAAPAQETTNYASLGGRVTDPSRASIPLRSTPERLMRRGEKKVSSSSGITANRK